MKKNLIIWDFDGVIADSEKIWIKNRQNILNEKFNLGWDFETTNNYLGGMSDKSKRDVLTGLGIITDDAFWNECLNKDIECIKNKEMKVTPFVEDIIKSLNKYCIATGGVFIKTIEKLKSIDFWNKYFNESNLFTVDMVSKGKPEPDLFLYACNKMGEKPEDCLVIEDSLVGITAAKRAGIEVIAFLGSEMYQNDKYLSEVKKLGVENIFYDMRDVKYFLLNK
ncbi:MAG: HAD family phosphatase [Alphaproteobacteria bacterium]|nr:HAD family phosphatase [Alphaproteobacteria bacterium]